MNRAMAVAAVLFVLALPTGAPANIGMLKLQRQNLCAMRGLPGYEDSSYERAGLEAQIASIENQLLWACYNEGVAAVQAGDYSTGIARLDEVVEWGMPDDNEFLESWCLFLGHAHFHYAMDNGRDAEHLELAARVYHDANAYSVWGDPLYRVLEARALAALGDDAGARAALDHSPGDREYDPEYWGCRSEAFGLLGDTDEERACMERAQGIAAGTLAPPSPETPPAAPVTTEPVATTPAFSPSEVSAAEVYLMGQEAFDRGDYATAAELFCRSLSIADDVWVWTMLGLTYDALGDKQAAESCYARVEGREPQSERVTDPCP